MKKYGIFILPAVILTVFIIWTILVKTVDVVYIDKIGFLGFYGLNTEVNTAITKSVNTALFDKLSDGLLIFSLITILPFAGIGVYQLITRKSLKAVDKEIYMLLVMYIITVGAYLIFEIVKINYGPTSTPEKLKASYPSSHVLASLCFIGINLFGAFHYVGEERFKIARIIYLCAGILVMGTSVVFRMLSGQHYLTDIIGGVLLSLAIIATCFAWFKFVKDNKPTEAVEAKVEDNA